MKKLDIEFQNCYGIPTLTTSFDFSSGNSFSLYAPNGTMKTSFSRTFKDFSGDISTKDAVFPERESKRVIHDENGADIPKTDVFVIEPYNEKYTSEKISSLLVNPTIKQEYDDAVNRIEENKTALLQQLEKLSGIKNKNKTLENEICSVFGFHDFLHLLNLTVDYSSSIPPEKMATIKYTSLFNEKAKEFLDSGGLKEELIAYIHEYDKLVQNSPLLNKKFNHIQANNVQKTLDETGFFGAKHKVSLFNGISYDDFNNAKDLTEKIESEKQRILNDVGLVKKLDAIDKKLKNDDLRELRDHLYEHQEILTELNDLITFRKNLFVSYLLSSNESFVALQKEFQKYKPVIENANRKAHEEKTKWEEVVQIFKERFTVPFELSIENQENVILQDDAPHIVFTFRDKHGRKKIEKNELVLVLSQGEKRALYLLNIIFELQARVKSRLPSLLIIDDIADSFDYKNKYAIVEYLYELSQDDLFCMIFLSHNFDFYRTISSRLGLSRKHRLYVSKNDDVVTIKEEKYQKDPFNTWRNNLNNEQYFIAAIPFVRNLAEYCGLDDEFIFLTSVLHIKDNTSAITIGNVRESFSKVLKNVNVLSPENTTLPIRTLVCNQVDKIMKENEDNPELETKIILSMAIRHKAEEYMINKITDNEFIHSITKNQTMELFKKYKQSYPDDKKTIALLCSVNIMTPESIHLNTFMYEPLLDMSVINLKQLYQKVSDI